MLTHMQICWYKTIRAVRRFLESLVIWLDALEYHITREGRESSLKVNSAAGETRSPESVANRSSEASTHWSEVVSEMSKDYEAGAKFSFPSENILETSTIHVKQGETQDQTNSQPYSNPSEITFLVEEFNKSLAQLGEAATVLNSYFPQSTEKISLDESSFQREIQQPQQKENEKSSTERVSSGYQTTTTLSNQDIEPFFQQIDQEPLLEDDDSSWSDAEPPLRVDSLPISDDQKPSSLTSYESLQQFDIENSADRDTTSPLFWQKEILRESDFITSSLENKAGPLKNKISKLWTLHDGISAEQDLELSTFENKEVSANLEEERYCSNEGPSINGKKSNGGSIKRDYSELSFEYDKEQAYSAIEQESKILPECKEKSPPHEQDLKISHEGHSKEEEKTEYPQLKSAEPSTDLNSTLCAPPEDISHTLSTLITNIGEQSLRGNFAVINLESNHEDVVSKVAKDLGMKTIKTETGWDWDVYWTSLKVTIPACQKLLRYQRVNRFPNSWKLGLKHNLATLLNRMANIYPYDYRFHPRTWCLPKDFAKLERYYKLHACDWFIVKPTDGLSGNGIKLTNSIKDLSECTKNEVCQLYIRPFLIDGYKFDLRIYTLITSCQPLRVFVYKEGLARFTTAKYEEPSSRNRRNRFMHLTNYYVNKYSSAYVVGEKKGTLRRLTTIKDWFIRHKLNAKKIWNSMYDAIIKTVIVMLPALKRYYRASFPDQTESNSCFHIWGFDILIGRDLRPYVLEINHSPSFTAEAPLDIEMTEALIYDTFRIMNLPDYSARNEEGVEDCTDEELTRRRIEWENTHMGNYKKIYPNNRLFHYQKYIEATEHFLSKMRSFQ